MNQFFFNKNNLHTCVGAPKSGTLFPLELQFQQPFLFFHTRMSMVSMLELSERDFAACKLSIEKTLRNRAPLHSTSGGFTLCCSIWRVASIIFRRAVLLIEIFFWFKVNLESPGEPWRRPMSKSLVAIKWRMDNFKVVIFWASSVFVLGL